MHDKSAVISVLSNNSNFLIYLYLFKPSCVFCMGTDTSHRIVHTRVKEEAMTAVWAFFTVSVESTLICNMQYIQVWSDARRVLLHQVFQHHWLDHSAEESPSRSSWRILTLLASTQKQKTDENSICQGPGKAKSIRWWRRSISTTSHSA